MVIFDVVTRLKYYVIKSKRQYVEYCKVLEALASKRVKSSDLNDEIELLTVLIEKWDRDHNSFENTDPVSLIKSLMQSRNMKAQNLVTVLKVSKGLVSDMLNYKKGLSKETVRKLAVHFKIDQAAFNRQYSINKTQQNKSSDQIKPILYHSFGEKEKLEKDLLHSMPKGKRKRVSTELMSIFHAPKKATKQANKKSFKKRSGSPM